MAICSRYEITLTLLLRFSTRKWPCFIPGEISDLELRITADALVIYGIKDV